MVALFSSLAEKFFGYCSTFRLYLIIIVQPWTNYAQKIHLTNYRQTVQLVTFYLYLVFHASAVRFIVISFWILGATKQGLKSKKKWPLK